jgi:nitroreductase
MLLLMELTDVVRRRRMVRTYSSRPVDRAVLDRILENALHAPSAGFSQGWAFLVLDDPDDVARFWRSTAEDGLDEPDSWLRGMMTAPVVIVPLSHKDAYLDRYAEPDKGWSDRDESRWPVPYWDLDTAMASLLMLLTVVDEGLGACFFGIPPTAIPAFRGEFGIPEGYMPIGAITVGHRVADGGTRGSASRGRRPLAEVVHRGDWGHSWPASGDETRAGTTSL